MTDAGRPLPDDKQQYALSEIRAYLDSGYSLDAIREAGWASWIDHLEAKGYNLRPGRVAVHPPDTEPTPKLTRDEKAGPTASGANRSTSGIEANPFDSLVVRPVRAWWAFSMKHQGLGRFLALSAPLLSIVLLASIIFATVSGGDQTGGSDRTSPSSNQRSEARTSGTDVTTVSGRGQEVSRFLTFEEGLVRFEVTHDGTSNIIIWLLRDDGSKLDLLVNEVGPFDGSMAVRIPVSGRYLLDVDADGNWKVTARQ